MKSYRSGTACLLKATVVLAILAAAPVHAGYMVVGTFSSDPDDLEITGVRVDPTTGAITTEEPTLASSGADFAAAATITGGGNTFNFGVATDPTTGLVPAGWGPNSLTFTGVTSTDDYATVGVDPLDPTANPLFTLGSFAFTNGTNFFDGYFQMIHQITMDIEVIDTTVGSIGDVLDSANGILVRLTGGLNCFAAGGTALDTSCDVWSDILNFSLTDVWSVDEALRNNADNFTLLNQPGVVETGGVTAWVQEGGTAAAPGEVGTFDLEGRKGSLIIANLVATSPDTSFTTPTPESPIQIQVPEPSTWSLLLFGAGLLAFRKLRMTRE